MKYKKAPRYYIQSIGANMIFWNLTSIVKTLAVVPKKKILLFEGKAKYDFVQHSFNMYFNLVDICVHLFNLCSVRKKQLICLEAVGLMSHLFS